MEEAKKKEMPGRGMYEWLQAITGILVVLILVFTFLGRITPVKGVSMEPTLYTGDLMLVRSLGYTPEQGDVVVLTKEFDAASGPIVKRVIATGGQRVDIDYSAGLVYVDGVPLEEPYINERMQQPWYGGHTSVLVPEGSVFVMGDNRNHSNDSRDVTLGTVDERYILGQALLVFFPFRNLGAIT